MKLQWHDKMEAGEAVVNCRYCNIRAIKSDVLQQIHPFWLFASRSESSCLALSTIQSNTPFSSLCLYSLILYPVHAVINHPVTVTGLLLIVILQLPCLMEFVLWFSHFHWTYIESSFLRKAVSRIWMVVVVFERRSRMGLYPLPCSRFFWRSSSFT